MSGDMSDNVHKTHEETKRRLRGAEHLLRQVEWSIGHGHCSVCEGNPADGHHGDCALAAWLNAPQSVNSED